MNDPIFWACEFALFALLTYSWSQARRRHRHGIHRHTDAGDRVHAGDGAADRADAGADNHTLSIVATPGVPVGTIVAVPAAGGGGSPGLIPFLMTADKLWEEPSPPPREERTGYAIGFRGWTITLDGWLQSLGVVHVWQEATIRARHVHWLPDTPPCKDMGSPHWKCTCGVYAFKSLPSPMVMSGPHVLGIIAGWGRTFEHGDGFRCQHARILALVGFGSNLIHGASCVSMTFSLEDIAHRYGVPIVAPEAAEAFAFEHGERWT